MEIDVGTWVESYARAWEEVDAEAGRPVCGRRHLPIVHLRRAPRRSRWRQGLLERRDLDPE